MFDLLRFQDIQIDDKDLKVQYYRNILNGDVDNAQRIYADNPQLKGKCVNAENLNNLLLGILDLERLYDTNVTQFLNDELSNFHININEMIYMQDFNPSTQYNVNNFVLYNDEIYFCVAKPPINTLPTNATYWLYLGLKGEQGASSLGVEYKGIWVSNVTYKPKDMVSYDNDLYVAINGSKGENPSMSPTNWHKSVDMIEQIIYVSETEPSGLIKGDIWIEIL